MICKINHDDTLAIPLRLCRICSPAILGRVAAHPLQLVDNPRLSNLTDHDRTIIDELTEGSEAYRRAKAAARIAKLKLKAASKQIPDGAVWDQRNCRWRLP